MIVGIVFLIVLNFVAIALAVWLVAKDEADMTGAKLMITAALVTGLNIVLTLMIGTSGLHWVLQVILLVVVLTVILAVLFHYFLYLQWRNAWIAAVIFFVVRVVGGLLLTKLFSAAVGA